MAVFNIDDLAIADIEIRLVRYDFNFSSGSNQNRNDKTRLCRIQGSGQGNLVARVHHNRADGVKWRTLAQQFLIAVTGFYQHFGDIGFSANDSFRWRDHLSASIRV